MLKEMRSLNKYVALIGCVMAIAIVITSCGKKEKEPVACEHFPLVDDHFLVKVKDGDFMLRLPNNSGARNNDNYYNDISECQYLRAFSIDYLWYQGKLIPEWSNQFKVPKDEYRPVRIYFSAAGLVKNITAEPDEAWRYEGALKHKKFPLEYYPKFEWDNAENKPPKVLQSSVWGILDTKYKSLIYHHPFTASCSISQLNPADSFSRIEADFAVFGDSKCRGTIVAEKDGKYIGVMIDVWAYRGGEPTQQSIREINKIYDAAVEDLQTFIQE